MQKLIFDRTSADITRAKQLINKAKILESLTDDELEEYLNGLKGCYNIIDLNRVEEAVQYLSNLLNSLNYKNQVNTKHWEVGQLFTLDNEMPRYLQNIENIRNAIIITDNVPKVPKTYKSVTNANNIERILFELSQIIVYLKQRFIHSGVSNLAQNRNWQQRFRTSRTWESQNYMLSQYSDDDTVNTISSQDEYNITKTTYDLELTDINIFDNPKDTVKSLNESMEILDALIGGEN